MAPKQRVFTAPDGKQFTSKAEYRDYLMATFYSWKDKKGGEFTKSPGEIDGQVFDLGDSSNATFVVMDRTEQVQIDRLTNCKVFLGCCSSSIFIRDCTGCEFYTCCRQLRLRGVTNSRLFVYSQAEVHIEESEGVSFAPFNGGYPEQKDHFAAAGMTCDDNLWYDIFDHNDPDKSGSHWSLIAKSDYGAAWWPAGQVGTPFIPITESGTVQKVGEEGSNKDASQAGKAFSMEDMRAQAAVQAMEDMNQAVEAMSMESALLVMSALGKGIDLSVWLMEGEEVPVEDFNDKFTQLALTLGVGEDWETKQELDLAVATKSLKQIEALFGKPSRKGVKCVDVTMFLNCSKQKVSTYLANMEDGADEEVQTENSGSPSTNKAIAPSVSATTINSGSSGASAMGDSVSQISQINEDEEELVVQGDMDADEVQLELGSIEAPNPYATQALLPDSPYDEEVAFSVDDDDEVDTFDQRRRRKPGGGSKSSQAGKPPPAPATTTTTTTTAATAPPAAPSVPAVQRPKTIPRARPASAAPGPRRIRADSPEKIKESRDLAASRVAEAKAAANAGSSTTTTTTVKTAGQMAIKGNEVRGGSFSRAPRSGLSPSKRGPATASIDTRKTPLSTSMSLSISTSDKENVRESSLPLNRTSTASASVLRQSLASATTTVTSLTAYVERKARHIAQSSDLYHLVQVYLGFIDKYMLVPARGKIVPSKARPWLPVADLQEAFLAARTTFSEAHVYALMKLVVAFAKSSGMETEADGDSLFSGVAGIIDVGSGGRKLSSEWLQKYLVHLRLTKPKPPLEEATTATATATATARSSRDTPLKFDEWLGGKKAEDAKDAGKKDKEFRKALAGRSADLDREEIKAMLTKNSIIPAEILKKYISLRVQAYILDVDGRKDFTHDLHFALRKWGDEQEPRTEFKRVSDQEMRKRVLTELKTKLLKEKAEELRASEANDQALTRSLFAQYAKERKADNYGPYGKNWGTWLSGEVEDLDTLVKKSREVDTQRERLLVERTARKMEVAPLRMIEAKFDDCCTMMRNHDHAIEIRKCLVRLRKRALEANLGKTGNILVTKALFDQEMAFVLAPYMMELSEELKGLAEEARYSHVSVGQTFQVDKQFEGLIGKMFKQDQEVALHEGNVLKTAKEEEFASDFSEWKRRVAEKKKAAAEARSAKEEEKKKEEDKKKKKADKAYKKWLKLRKGGKYVTKTAEGKKVVRPVPASNRVEHDARWSKDVEVELADTSFL